MASFARAAACAIATLSALRHLRQENATFWSWVGISGRQARLRVLNWQPMLAIVESNDRSEIVEQMLMTLTRRRLFLTSAVVPAISSAGCGRPRATLAQVFAPASGQLMDGAGEQIEVGTLLDSTAGRPVTVSFGYIGCGGQAPRIDHIRAATRNVAQAEPCNLVLDAIDDVSRFPEVERDIMGSTAGHGAARTRIMFVKPDSWSVRQNNRTVHRMLQVMNARYGENSYLQSIRWVALFSPDGSFRGFYW